MISSCSTLHFLICIWVTHTILSLLLPMFAILIKWVLIGRYKPGMYPLWGHYYLRWWFVTRVVDACGIGPLFRYNNWWRCWYFRLLGAKVGQDVKISPGAQISEWDLISIGDGVVIDASVISPFAAQGGAMILKPISMAQLSGIGVSSVLGPGDSLPYGVVLGPLSCGLEANNSSLEAVSKHHRNLVRPSFPEPSQLKQWSIGVPCILFVMMWAVRDRMNPRGMGEEAVIDKREDDHLYDVEPITAFARIYRPRFWWYVERSMQRRRYATLVF